MTLDDLVNVTIVREGGYAEPPAVEQPTKFGITVPSLAAWRNRPCMVSDLKALSLEEAQQFYRDRFTTNLREQGFDRIADEHLRVQLLDYAVNSGPARAVRWLQRTIGLVPELVTGIIDDRTLKALRVLPGYLVNNALAGERAHAAWHGGVQANDAAGVARRAIDFIVPLDQSEVPQT